LLIHFLESEFRFGVAPASAQGFSVLPITAHEARTGRDYDGIVLARKILRRTRTRGARAKEGILAPFKPGLIVRSFSRALAGLRSSGLAMLGTTDPL
jgi:hypothetical protein